MGWTGRILRDDMRGYISAKMPPILARLAIEPKYWLFLTTQFDSKLKSLVGCVFAVKRAAKKLGYIRSPGFGVCKTVFS